MSGPAADARQETCCVVVCTRNRPEQLDACLSAVLAQTHRRFDVLVVDNASGDARSCAVAARHGVRYVCEPRVGVSVARNRGAREARTADLVVYVDDDAVPESGWLDALCAEFADPRVMAAAGRILPLRPDTEGARLCTATGILDGGPRRRAVDRDDPHWFEALRDGMGGAANMAVRRRVLSVWPGFDERLGRGTTLRAGEEDYAFLALVALGYRVVYTPHAVVRHPFPATAADLARRHLDGLAASVGCLAFVCAERVELRRTVASHLLRRLPRARRRSFQRSPVDARRLASRWRELWAGIDGLRTFARFAAAQRAHEHAMGARGGHAERATPGQAPWTR